MPLAIGNGVAAAADEAAAQNEHLRRMASVLRERGLARGEYEDGRGRLDLIESSQAALRSAPRGPFDLAGAAIERLVWRAMGEGLMPPLAISPEDIFPEAIMLSDGIAAARGHRDGAEALAALCEREAGAAP